MLHIWWVGLLAELWSFFCFFLSPSAGAAASHGAAWRTLCPVCDFETMRQWWRHEACWDWIWWPGGRRATLIKALTSGSSLEESSSFICSTTTFCLPFPFCLGDREPAVSSVLRVFDFLWLFLGATQLSPLPFSLPSLLSSVSLAGRFFPFREDCGRECDAFTGSCFLRVMGWYSMRVAKCWVLIQARRTTFYLSLGILLEWHRTLLSNMW